MSKREMNKRAKERKGWHFLALDKRLGYDDGRKVKLGERLEARGFNMWNSSPEPCKPGMHATTKIVNGGFFHRVGPVLCRVEVTGEVKWHDDRVKFVGRYRKVLWWKRITRDVLEACAKHCGIHVNNGRYFYDENKSIWGKFRYADERTRNKAEAWFRNWAEQNGCP